MFLHEIKPKVLNIECLFCNKQKQAFEQEHAGVQIGAQIAKDKRDQALTALQTATQAAPKGETE